jgi:hypothetical protein
MTLIDETTRTDFDLVTIDLYRDIHKGIRADLFGVITTAGSLDPADKSARIDLQHRVHSVVELLVSHAEHEDAAVQPAIELHLPALAETIARDHATFETRMVTLRDMADVAVTTPSDVHRLYLEFASFTSAYLEHQDVEERIVMPALERAIGVDAALAIHQAIVGSIPPDEMAKSLALMLPAMNIDNRAELLGGMRAGAPAEVFEGVWGLAASVLAPADHEALGRRLGIG